MDKIEVKRRDQGCKSVTYLTNKLKHKSRCSWFTGVVAPIQDLWVVLTMCRIRSGHHYECIIGTPRVLINSCTSHLPFIGLTHFKLFRHAINRSFKENKWVIFCLCYLINFCLPSSLMLSEALLYWLVESNVQLHLKQTKTGHGKSACDGIGGSSRENESRFINIPSVSLQFW